MMGYGEIGIHLFHPPSPHTPTRPYFPPPTPILNRSEWVGRTTSLVREGDAVGKGWR